MNSENNHNEKEETDKKVDEYYNKLHEKDRKYIENAVEKDFSALIDRIIKHLKGAFKGFLILHNDPRIKRIKEEGLKILVASKNALEATKTTIRKILYEEN